MYGPAAITPNMHMHCYLKSVILDHGPVYRFWLFSYERYNGILQHQPTNNHSIEIQIMQSFVQDNKAYAFQPPNVFSNESSAESDWLSVANRTRPILITTAPFSPCIFR